MRLCNFRLWSHGCSHQSKHAHVYKQKREGEKKLTGNVQYLPLLPNTKNRSEAVCYDIHRGEKEWRRQLTISQINLDAGTSKGKVQHQTFTVGKLADQFQHLSVECWNFVPRRRQKVQGPGTLQWFPLTLLPSMKLHVGPASHTLLSIDPQCGESHCWHSPFLAQGWRLHAWHRAAFGIARQTEKKSPVTKKQT